MLISHSKFFALRLIVYVFIFVFAKKIVRHFIKIIFKKAYSVGEKKRLKTIESLFSNIAVYTVYVALVLIVLKEFGVDTTPLLTGAGIVGLAFSFGTQSLIKDLIYGIFIIIENQFNVGDEVEIAGMRGKVKKMSLRTTVLEDEEGNLIFIPNSEVKKVKIFKISDDKDRKKST